MWPFFVVFVYPVLCYLSYLCESSEDIHIQYFVSIRTIESLDVRVLSRLAWLDKFKLNAMGFRPFCQSRRDKFWAVIWSQLTGISTPKATASKCAKQSVRYQTKSNLRQLYVSPAIRTERVMLFHELHLLPIIFFLKLTGLGMVAVVVQRLVSVLPR